MQVPPWVFLLIPCSFQPIHKAYSPHGPSVTPQLFPWIIFPWVLNTCVHTISQMWILWKARWSRIADTKPTKWLLLLFHHEKHCSCMVEPIIHCRSLSLSIATSYVHKFNALGVLLRGSLEILDNGFCVQLASSTTQSTCVVDIPNFRKPSVHCIRSSCENANHPESSHVSYLYRVKRHTLFHWHQLFRFNSWMIATVSNECFDTFATFSLQSHVSTLFGLTCVFGCFNTHWTLRPCRWLHASSSRICLAWATKSLPSSICATSAVKARFHTFRTLHNFQHFLSISTSSIASSTNQWHVKHMKHCTQCHLQSCRSLLQCDQTL